MLKQITQMWQVLHITGKYLLKCMKTGEKMYTQWSN